MTTENYSLNVQTFERLIHENRIYVDKTELISQLVREGGNFVYFLSRPRRFGKSLLISTLKAIFEGKKELFEGLYIYDKIKWKSFPVIHISMSDIDFIKLGLEEAIQKCLREIANEHEFQLLEETPNTQFKELIKKLTQKYQTQVVVLIDEYDKPITQGLEFDGVELAIKNRDIMKSFYSGMKDMDTFFRFIFITGISKFTRVSIFSELNHITDITLDKRYVNLCGYTQAELEKYFPKGIAQLAENEGISKEECLQKIKDWYDGFSWDGKNFVYNPFSTLRLFDSHQFSNYWFESGTPTFLIKMMRKLATFDLDTIEVRDSTFSTHDLRNLNMYSLLLQTGYLSLKQRISDGEDAYFVASFPNKEVRQSFNEMFLGDYLDMDGGITGVNIFKIKDAFLANDVKRVLQIIETLFKAVPSHLFSKQNAKGKYSSVGENFYHAIIYLIFNLLGVKMKAEVVVRDGRVDAVVETQAHIYLFEFKKNLSPSTAIQQMIDNDYAGKYALSGKIIHLIGVSFSLRKRGLNAWEEKVLA